MTSTTPTGRHAAPLGQCVAIGCTRTALQTASFDNDSRQGGVQLCDLDAAYMAGVPHYRAPGWGAHRTPVTDEAATQEHYARWMVEQHVRALLDAEDAATDGLVEKCVNAVAAEQLLGTVRRFHDGQVA